MAKPLTMQQLLGRFNIVIKDQPIAVVLPVLLSMLTSLVDMVSQHQPTKEYVAKALRAILVKLE